MRSESPVTTPPPAPRHVERLLAFTNSVDNEEQTDDLTTPGELSAWLKEQELTGARGVRATADDLTLARSLRDAIRDSMRAHHDGLHDVKELDRVAADLPLRLAHHPDGTPGLEPVESGVRGALALMLVAVADAAADDSWRRLKICAFDECQWAFYDHSKNRSRTWCEWGCGNKVKTRNYRARRRATTG